jgi:hypothetical protein
MDRFTAYLLVRRFLRQRASRNQALVVEAIMEELAVRHGAPAAVWGLLGLLSQLDLEYAQTNPDARGRTAGEQARLEGLEADLAGHLDRWHDLDPRAAYAPVEDALFLATTITQCALDRVPDVRALAAEPARESWCQDLRRCRAAGDPSGDRLDGALSRLVLAEAEAARLATAALRRVAAELR